MKRYLLIFIVLVSGFVTPTIVASYGQEGAVVRRVKIKRNSAFYDSKIKSVFKLKGTNIFQRWIMRRPRDVFYQELLDEDLANVKVFYQKEGFLNFTYDSVLVIPSHNKNKVKIIAYLNEAKPYYFGSSSIVVNGDKRLSDFFKGQALKVKPFGLQTKKGNRFLDAAVYADEIEINRWFADEGYPYSSLTKRIALVKDSLVANLDWSVTTGPICRFGQVDVTGMEKISQELILKNNTCKEGQLYSRAETENTQKQIVDLGVFSIVTLTPTLSATKSDTIPIRINVKESPRFSTKFGLGYGKEERVRAFVKLQKIGVFGGARRGEFNAKTNYLEPYNISLRFTQPAFVLPFTSLVLYPYIAKQNEPGYKLTKIGGSLVVQKYFTKDFVNSISYTYENVNLDTTSVADIPQNTFLNSEYSKAGATWACVYDNTFPKFDPRSGFVASLNTKLNGGLIKQDYPFGKISVEYKKYFVPYKKWVLASKILLGSMFLLDNGSSIPVEERYFSGGVGSMRGWPRYGLGPLDENGVPKGGKSLVEAGIELRIPVINPFRVVMFVEAGNVWSESFYWRPNELRYNAGVGIRMDSPIGPIGFDVASPIYDKYTTLQFIINIGPSF